jgi:hypothetical protein
MDASEFPESRERKGESSKAEKFSSWRESGRVDVRRERYMVDRIKESMEPFNVGLFIVGLAHLHSTGPLITKRCRACASVE